MSDQETLEKAVAIGPNGRPLRLEDLPAPDTRRWVARRKAEVVAAVRGGLLSLEEACRRYNLSAEEYQSWERLIDQHGLVGLRVTKLQEFR
ncbi:MAG: DUF1153 domain-containing protein [Geminicoccaceae bacterium]|nr:DUF1153 domain-containing protein [Geminicoccaceae bacterium]